MSQTPISVNRIVANASPKETLPSDPIDACETTFLPENTARIAFITNFCPHYRVETFQKLAEKYKVFFYFFSQGTEWYWLKEHGVRNGDFQGEYLGGTRKSNSKTAIDLIRRLWNVPYDVYIKCINGRFALPLTYMIARLRGKPFILWTGIWQTLQTPFHRLILPITRFIYRNSDAIIVYGEHVKSFLVEQGTDPRRIFIAHHAVDNKVYSREIDARERDDLRTRLKLARDTRIVLYIGRLENEKGIPFLLRAFASLHFSDVTLLLVGQGRENESLAALVRSLGINEKVRFVGYVPPEDTIALYSLSYAMVLPSISTPRGREPWGLVVNEAMNQGLPIIATDAVGAAAGGLIRDKQNGFIVPEQNSEKLAEALDVLLNSPGLRAQMSQIARETIQDWDNDRMVAGFCKAVEYVLQSSRKTTD
jgi:glycosyltransferase involved in cell wall biosynthesis